MVTIVTLAVGPDWASATTAIGTVAVAVVAVGVALFTERRAGQRLREEHKRGDDLLARSGLCTPRRSQKSAPLLTRGLLNSSRTVMPSSRRSVPTSQNSSRRTAYGIGASIFYARISLALRRYIEKPTGPDGKPVLAPDVLELANLASEATMLASKPLADLLNQFMYDFPDEERQLAIWGEFQHAARAELEVDRIQEPPTSAPGTASDDLQHGNPLAIPSSDP